MRRMVYATVVLISAAGCMINPRYLPDGYSAARLADGRLSLNLAYEKYEQLGGKGSSGLNSFIASAVAKQRMCVNDFTVDEPMPARGYVHILVTCRAKGA